MKKIFSFLLLIAALLLVGCDNSNENNVNDNLNNTTDVDSSNILMTYAASYSKTAGPMGVIVGGHLIEFYKDNTLLIHAGFASAVGEAQVEYQGTYTLEDNNLTINYKYDDTEATVSAKIENNMFRCQIFMIQSMPDDGSDDNIKGLTYYKIDSKSYHPMSKIYIGVYKDSNSYNAYSLELKNDNTFELVANINNNFIKATGSYEIIIKSIDEVDEISFTYNILDLNNNVLKENYNSNFEYSSETRFRFEYLYNTLDGTNTTQLVYLK